MQKPKWRIEYGYNKDKTANNLDNIKQLHIITIITILLHEAIKQRGAIQMKLEKFRN